jgi:hypothetical protein
MNIIINPSDIIHENGVINKNRIHFLNTKRNITMDGEFTKLLFVTEHFSTDSLFVYFPVQLQIDTRINYKSETFSTFCNENNQKFKKQAIFKPNTINKEIISKFTEFEKQILNYYKTYKNINKRSMLLLNNTLLTGNIKLFTSSNSNDKNKNYGIKISGIWESHETVGITYKIIELD